MNECRIFFLVKKNENNTKIYKNKKVIDENVIIAA